MAGQTTRTELRRAAAPIWNAIYRHPFVVEVGRGTLPREKFRFFISQDYLYLKEFTRVLCLGGAKARELDTMQLFALHAHNTVLVERAMHAVFARRLGLTARQLEATNPAPVTVAYTRHLLTVAHAGSLAELVAAVLPCYWIYREVGQRLLRRIPKQPLYARWIRAYAAPQFTRMVNEQLRLVDQLGREASRDERARMRSHFLRSSHYEYLFWDQAYRLARWPA
ncbi:MAG: thiaminase II [Candidatus Rokubacteria bacterium]|nr:thiaminase II [Candidatus Rokubacteria bacterium]